MVFFVKEFASGTCCLPSTPLTRQNGSHGASRCCEVATSGERHRVDCELKISAPANLTIRRLLSALSFGREDIVIAMVDDDDMLVFEPIKEPLGGNIEPALVHAAQRGCSAKIMAFLLRRGADPDGTGSSGLTALGVLAAAPVSTPDSSQICDLGPPLRFWMVGTQFHPSCDLERHFPHFSHGLFPSTTSGFQSVGGEGANKNSHLFVAEDHCLECGRCLLQFGADPHFRDATGRTAIDVAEAKGKTRFAAFLRYHHEIATCVFLRAMWCRKERVKTPPGLVSMRDDMQQVLCGFLMPQ